METGSTFNILNMKYILYLFFLIASCYNLRAQDTIVGTAFHVIDGDTYWLNKATVNGIPADPSEVFKIRIAGADAPEQRGYSDSDQPGGRMVADSMRKLIKGQKVTVIKLGSDEWGRIIGRVYVGGIDVTSRLLQSGFAWYLPTKGLSRILRKQYKAEFEAAKNERRGVFEKAKNPETPAKFRENHRYIKPIVKA